MSSSLKEVLSTNSLIHTANLEEQNCPSGSLYIVGLPIGNLGDITLRAIWILAHVDFIAAEDTRQTRKLLDKFGINAKLISVREHNERHGADIIMQQLSEGMRVALVTDAGTPGVSDPGARAVKVIRDAGYKVIPIPGASAVVTALSAAGLEGKGFCFVGFLPPQAKARQKALSYWVSRKEPFVLYEAPHRVLDLLGDLAKCIAPDRRVIVAREITKKFETFSSLCGETLREWVKTHTPKGEYVILIDEAPEEKLEMSEETIAWLGLLAKEMPTSKLAAVATKVTGISRDELYQYICTLK